MRTAVRPHAARIVALVIIAPIVLVNAGAGLNASVPSELSGRFRFTERELPAASGQPPRAIRRVNPSVAHIDAWISAVGAAIALNDLDGNGRDDDACHVDPRFDTVTVLPVPGTEQRYAPISLETPASGPAVATTAPTGCLPGDFDEDGEMDLLVYYWGRAPVLFIRTGRGYVERELVSPPQRWNTNSATLADVDGDGHIDIIVGNYFRDGDRVLDPRSRTGVTMQSSMSRATNGGTNRILLWEAPGRFREADDALTPEMADGWTLAVGAQDLTGDVLPELYFANDFGSDRLLLNRSTPGRVLLESVVGAKSFLAPSSTVLGRDSFKGMGIDFGDLNADLVPDMLVSNITEPFALQESNLAWMSTGQAMRDGHAPYVDGSETLGLARSGWAWDVRLDDFDANGTLEAVQAIGFIRGTVNRWPELQELAIANDALLSNPANWPNFGFGTELNGHGRGAFFSLGADGRFHDIAARIGLERRQVSRGVATADVDGDGDLDFALANQWQPSYVYLNECPRCGRALGLRLRLPLTQGDAAGSRPAIGAQATIRLPDGRAVTGQIDGGNGHSGKRSNTMLFGLGDFGGAVHVRIRWRNRNGVEALTRTLRPGWHTIVLRAGGDTA